MTACVISIDEQFRRLCTTVLRSVGSSEPAFLTRFDGAIDADLYVWDLHTGSPIPPELTVCGSRTHIAAAEAEIAADLRESAPWVQIVLKPVTFETLRSHLTDAERQRANRGSTDFVARAARELRAPLHALDGYCELLRDGRISGALSGIQTNVVEHMHHSIVRASRIADGLWSISSEGDPEWELVNGKIADCVQAAVDEIRFLLSGRQLTLDVALDDSDAEFRFATRRMQQAFAHVIEYACRCSPAHGSVKVSGTAIQSDSAPSRWSYRVDVCDSGPAVPEPALAALFSDAAPEQDTTVRPASFGLSIARKIIAAHRGTIWAQSGEETGLTISALLPSMPQAPAPMNVEAQPVSKSLSGQIIEGNL